MHMFVSFNKGRWEAITLNFSLWGCAKDFQDHRNQNGWKRVKDKDELKLRKCHDFMASRPKAKWGNKWFLDSHLSTRFSSCLWHKARVWSIQCTHHDDVGSQPRIPVIRIWISICYLGRIYPVRTVSNQLKSVPINRCYFRWNQTSQVHNAKLCDLGFWSCTPHFKSKYESKTNCHVKKAGGSPYAPSAHHAEHQFVNIFISVE